MSRAPRQQESVEPMREAIRLALEGLRAGKGGPFGAVVVLEGKIVGSGSNEVLSTRDPTAHAEVVAIRAASSALGRFHLEGAELYASCEPCPMCLGAAYWARIAKLYYACTRGDAAAAGFIDDFIYSELSLPPARRRLATVQMLRDEALLAFEEWRRAAAKTPY